MFDYHSSYLGIVVWLVLTGCGLPVPEEVPIVTAGILSSQHHLHPGTAFAACLVGALLGDLVLYTVGYHWGHSLITRHPRFAKLLHADQEKKVEKIIARHSFKVLMIARFMVGIRAPVYLAAGTIRLPLRRFLLTDAVCATTVVGSFFWLSYFFGDWIAGWIKEGQILLTVGVIIAICIVMLVAWRKVKRYLAEEVAEGNANGAAPHTNGELVEAGARQASVHEDAHPPL